MTRSVCLLTLTAVVLIGGQVRASDPIGGYMTVDKVVLAPANAPTTIQIWGSFVLATSNGGRSHTNPTRGYLYYKAIQGKEDICRKEWADFKRAAGTGQIIGFGSSYQWKELGKVRKADRKPESPDSYPLANGLVKYNADIVYSVVQPLLVMPAPQTPAEGDLVPPGEITLVARNVTSSKHGKVKYLLKLKGTAGDSEEAKVAQGQKTTRWTPKLKLKSGEKYTWSMQATEGTWTGPVVTSGFVVKGGK